MPTAQKKAIAYGGEGITQELIQCRQKQWTSGICKDRYCEGCPNKKECYELLGR